MPALLLTSLLTELWLLHSWVPNCSVSSLHLFFHTRFKVFIACNLSKHLLWLLGSPVGTLLLPGLAVSGRVIAPWYWSQPAVGPPALLTCPAMAQKPAFHLLLLLLLRAIYTARVDPALQPGWEPLENCSSPILYNLKVDAHTKLQTKHLFQKSLSRVMWKHGLWFPSSQTSSCLFVHTHK